MRPINRRPHPVWAAAIAAVLATADSACPATGSGTPSESGVATASGIEAAAAGRARPPAGALGMPRAWEGVAPGGGESPGPSQAPDPADVNWDDRFVLPNGVDNAAGSIPMP